MQFIQTALHLLHNNFEHNSDNMAPCGKLVFTTLAILNSIGMVSPKNEVEHGLAKDCDGKSMNE